jgi:hypothetical protein
MGPSYPGAGSTLGPAMTFAYRAVAAHGWASRWRWSAPNCWAPAHEIRPTPRSRRSLRRWKSTARPRWSGATRPRWWSLAGVPPAPAPPSRRVAAGASVLVIDRFPGWRRQRAVRRRGLRRRRHRPPAAGRLRRHTRGDVRLPAPRGARRGLRSHAAPLLRRQRRQPGLAGGAGRTLRRHDASAQDLLPARRLLPLLLGQRGRAGLPAGAEPPAPRGHRALAKGQAGETLYAALRAATLGQGARTITQATVRRLVRERTSGRVLGVEVWEMPPDDPKSAEHARLNARANRWRNWRAGTAERWRREAAALEQAMARRAWCVRRGVSCCAPAASSSTAPWSSSTRRSTRAAGRTATPAATAAASCWARAWPRRPTTLGTVSAWRFITPPYAWPKGIVVNLRGERFCNEQVYGATLGHAMVEEQGGRAWSWCWTRGCAVRQSANACLAACGPFRPCRRWH